MLQTTVLSFLFPFYNDPLTVFDVFRSGCAAFSKLCETTVILFLGFWASVRLTEMIYSGLLALTIEKDTD